MAISNFDIRMFNAARLEAEKSDYKHFHVGCVIAYKHTIIGHGHNSYKTHPVQKRYNEKYREFKFHESGGVRHSIHAEVAALMSIPYVVGKDVDFSKASVYVYRISPGRPKRYGCAKPCSACEAFIRDMGIKSVYYTDDSGLAYIEYY